MRRLLALALLIATASCSSDSSTNPTPDSLAGTWNLSTVNGLALPFLLLPGDPQASIPKVELLNDQIIASSAGTFTETGNARFTDASGVQDVPFTDSGTWTISGTAVTFRFTSDGSSGTGTLSGNTFTIGETGFSSVYVKQ
jgi:hypothetical protein